MSNNPRNTGSSSDCGCYISQFYRWIMELFEYEDWQAMPEFVQEKKEPYKVLTVRFETEQDYIEFQELIAQKLTAKTKSIWHPFKSHWGLKKMVYKDGN